MNMQIKLIALYNKNGEIRKIPFKIGKVNIITGKSSTGKSTLLDIVEYCLGQSEFRIPDGPIRESVEWYTVLYQTTDKQIFIGKKPPDNNGASRSNIFLKVGIDLTLPALDELIENSNDTALVDFLNSIVGISPNLNIPFEEHSRLPLEATIKHTRHYLFQKQGTVANQDILFHRQGEPFIPMAIKDTLPYFLGAVQEDRLKLIQELRNAKRNLALLQKRLEEAQNIASSELNVATSLLKEAQQVGIVEAISTPHEAEEIISILRAAVGVTLDTGSQVNTEIINKLRDEQEKVEEEIINKTHQIAAAESFAKEADGFSREATEQSLRLESISLFRERVNDHEHCPMCSSVLEHPTPSVAKLNDALSRLSSTLTGVSRERPKLREYIQMLYEEKDKYRAELGRIQSEISAVYEEYEAARRSRDRNARIARVTGRISLYLESVDIVDDLSPLQNEVKKAKDLVEYYEQELDPQEVQDRLLSILNYIGSLMTDWAVKLDLEHKGFPYRLDINKLTVIVDRKGKPVHMSRTMGGGSNWLGCHIIALAALHKYFVNENRPVPNFLILDQPTQVYFPPEKYAVMEGKADEVSDEDSIAVARLFDFLFDLCEELYPNFQIIVTDHANLRNPRFQEAVIEEPWRGDRALIPYSWIKTDIEN